MKIIDNAIHIYIYIYYSFDHILVHLTHTILDLKSDTIDGTNTWTSPILFERQYISREITQQFGMALWHNSACHCTHSPQANGTWPSARSGAQ